MPKRKQEGIGVTMRCLLGLLVSMMVSNCSCSTQREIIPPLGPEAWSYEVGHANIPEGDAVINVSGGPDQTGTYLAVHHKTSSERSWPATFAVYSSGYIRLTPVADEAIPFGTSVVLGPAYWSGDVYFHNPKIAGIRVAGDLQDAEVLTITAIGQLGDMDVEYTIRLHEPNDKVASCDVAQRAKWRDSAILNADRNLAHEAFKIVQFSSMFFDSTYHDADSVAYIGSNGYVSAEFANMSALVFSDPLPLKEPWLEVAHSDDEGWQGPTPSVSVMLSDSVDVSEYTPQGWVTHTDNQNDDNVGVWLNWDKAPATFETGDMVTNNYTVTASTTPHAVPVE